MTAKKRYTYKTKAQAAAALGVTEAVLDTIGNAAYDVYQEIGADLATLNNGKPMRRSTVIEVSLDAGRPEQLLERQREQAQRNGRPTAHLSDAIAALQRRLDYEKLTAAMKLYFTYAFYE